MIYLKQAPLLLLLALTAGLTRQFFPQGIKWNGRWPTSETSAEDAYKMMAKPGDPAFVSLAQAIQIHDQKKANFLDARASKDYKEGRIPGARCFPFYEVEKFQAAALQGLNAESPLILYCEGVGCELSFLLGRELQQSGYRNVKIFYGGYPEWKQAGLPIEK